MKNMVANSDVINAEQKPSLNISEKGDYSNDSLWYSVSRKFPNIWESMSKAIKEHKANIAFHFSTG